MALCSGRIDNEDDGNGDKTGNFANRLIPGLEVPNDRSTSQVK
jgi:hypothetical protein